MAKRKRLTAKERVLKKYPSAQLWWQHPQRKWYGIYLPYRSGQRLISGLRKTARQAWADAARRLRKPVAVGGKR